MARRLRDWHGEAVETWRARWGVPELRVYRTVGSTNDVARTRARAGAPAGTTVLAGAQTRGRGRRGRRWVAGPGQSLLLSMVTRPATAAGAVLSLRLGLAAARAVEERTGLAVGIKWPNDLLVDGRKIAGVLCEAMTEGDRLAFVVAGIGINLQPPADGWPGELVGRASSLAEEGAPVRLPELAGRVVATWLDALERDGPLGDDELDGLRRRDVLRGHLVTMDGVRGTAAGIAPDGGLRLDTGDGIRTVVAGTVVLARTEEEDTP